MPAHSGWCSAHDPHFTIVVCPHRRAVTNAYRAQHTYAAARAATGGIYCTRIHYAHDDAAASRAHVHVPRTYPTPSSRSTHGGMSFYQPPVQADADATTLGDGTQGDASLDAFAGQSEELSFYSFFGDLLVPEESERQAACEVIAQRLTEAAREVREEQLQAAQQATSPAAAALPTTPSQSAQLLATHLPSALRLALACPLEDITSAMRRLLHEIAGINPAYAKYESALSFAFRPSSFVPLSSCVDPTGQSSHAPVPAAASSSTACGDTNNLLVDIFLSTGRTSHMDLLMAWHPSFLTQYTSCIHFVMDGLGPLHHTWRNYLAIMAAARHRCEYLVSLQETEFLLKGGDPTWLQGIAHAPKKLQALCDLNALLAHQPWLITRTHIAALVDNAGADSWSMAELVHALIILSTYHALCGFVFGMGVRTEIDNMDWERWDMSKGQQPETMQRSTANAQSETPSSNSATTPLAGAQSSVASATSAGQMSLATSLSDGEHLLRLLSADPDRNEYDASESNAFNAAVEELGTSPAHADSTFAPRAGVTRGQASPITDVGDIGALNAALRSMHVDTTNPAYKYTSVPSSEPASSPAHASAQRIAAMRYSNFDVNSKAYSIFYLHDYSWPEHGYALVNRFYQGYAPMLDAEWDGIFHLTYNTVGDKKNVDSTPFRRAIWYYTHRLFGLQHDDFNYNKIPVFLTQSLKYFVKKVACAPDTITEDDYKLKGYNFLPDEKCHIVLLAIEARRQASLLYALHSVMKYTM